MEVRIITGYSKTPANEVALSLRDILKYTGHNVDVVDPFARERSSYIFNLTLLTKSPTKNLVEISEEQLPKKNIDVLIGYSYGGAMAILQSKCRTNKMVLLSPALADNTVIWSPVQKTLKRFFLPALKDMGSKELSEKLFQRLKVKKQEGVQIIFFLPCDEMGNIGDERVVYDYEIREKMKELGQIYYIPVKKHRDMISNPRIVERIIERLNI